MKIQFIGTGAADFDWSEYGKPGVLGSTSTLLDDHVLIDCGPTVPAALARFNADAAEITDIVITHNHSDHFDMESVKKIAGNGKKNRRKRWRPGGNIFFHDPQSGAES